MKNLVFKKYFLIVLILLFANNSHAGYSDATLWGYQLQNYDIRELENSDFDILVIDYSKDGTDENRFSSNEIQSIGENKKVLAYISIGEAEEYRYYFDNNWLNNPPEWFDGENPDWEGNYKVKYWYQEWQDVIYGYLDKIIDQQFQGVYLDIIDAYEYYSGSVQNSDTLMMDFVIGISDYMKTQSAYGEGFLIIPQNAEELLLNSTYRSSIDGIGKEDLYVDPDRNVRLDLEEIEYSESILDLLIQDDKLVLVVDYSQKQSLIRWAKNRAAEHGYLHYAGVLDLNELVDQSKFYGIRMDLLIIGLVIISLIITVIYFKRKV